MHGQAEIDRLPRRVWVAAHCALFALAVWLTVGGGIEELSGEPAGSLGRRIVLAGFGAVLLVRMTFLAMVLLKRRFGWEEAAGVTLAVAIYQVGFALLGAGEQAPLAWPDLIGIGLFMVGSWMNTWSEMQRRRFKQDPAHAGRLFTGGLFSIVRHPNYCGDLLWVTAWAVVTRNPLSLVVPAILAIAFATYFVPALSRHLEARYGEAYLAWAAQTPSLNPLVGLIRKLPSPGTAPVSFEPSPSQPDRQSQGGRGPGAP